MDRLRRTLSFRSRKKKRKEQTESAKPHQWQEDERKVREGTCSFQVKYLGCVEVFESRGMQVCEEAHKILRQQCRGKYQRAVLYVSGDALRVVDEISKNMKKSHRLSFRKKSKKRPKVVQAIIYVSGDSLRVIEDKAGVTTDEGQGLIVDQTIEKVSFCAPDRNHEKGFSYICRDGTTRRWMCHGFLALKESGERLSHAVGCAFAVCLEKKQKREKEAVSVSYNDDKTSFARLGSFRQATLTERLADPQSTKIVEPVDPTAAAASPVTARANVEIAQVERPHASQNLLLRQGSFNTFNKLNSQTSPFKRNLSLRLNELPSNLSRQQADFDKPITGSNIPIIEGDEPESPQKPVSTLASALTDSAPSKQAVEAWDPIAEMCQQLTKGLTGLNDDKTSTNNTTITHQSSVSSTTQSNITAANTTAAVSVNGADPIKQPNPWAAPAPQENDFWLPPAGSSSQTNTTTIQTKNTTISSSTNVAAVQQTARPRPTAGLHHSNTYAGSIAQPTVNGGGTHQQTFSPNHISMNNNISGSSLVNGGTSTGGGGGGIISPPQPVSNPQNPFDTAWALRSNTSSTNPFLPASAGAATTTGPTSNNTTTSTNNSHQQFSKEFEISM